MKLLTTLLIFIAAIYSLSATAGTYLGGGSVIVSVEPDGSGFGQGTLIDARISDNDVEYIRCGVKRDIYGLVMNSTTGHGRSFCAARNPEGLAISCTIDDENVAASLNAMNDSSYIGFYVNIDGVCERIDISNNSWNLLNPQVDKDRVK